MNPLHNLPWMFLVFIREYTSLDSIRVSHTILKAPVVAKMLSITKDTSDNRNVLRTYCHP